MEKWSHCKHEGAKTMADSGTHFMLSVDHSFIDQNEGITFLYWLWNHKFKGKMYQESGSGQQSLMPTSQRELSVNGKIRCMQ